MMSKGGRKVVFDLYFDNPFSEVRRKALKDHRSQQNQEYA